jgi:arsenate reductase-like glutaredoxin family protein
MTCGRTQEFLAKRKVETLEIVDAKKKPLTFRDGLALLDQVDELYAAKGKKVEHVDLRHGRPERAALERLLLGPTGRLRAPTLKVGRTLVIGFDEDTYRRVLG